MLALSAVVDPGALTSTIPAPVVTSRARANPLPTTRRCPVASSSCGMGLEVGPALGQQGDGQHLLGGHPAQLVEADRHGLGVIHRVRGGVMD